MTDRILIRPIKIMLDTNIPEKSMVPFTKSLLYNPILKTSDSLNEYPYFTQDIQFPYFLYHMTYEECVRFFFNKDEMMKSRENEEFQILPKGPPRMKKRRRVLRTIFFCAAARRQPQKVRRRRQERI